MGTEIYKRGVFINRCYDEVNSSAPDLVQDIHSAYVAASADVITTNTFALIEMRLVPFGLRTGIRHCAAGVRLPKQPQVTGRWWRAQSTHRRQLTPIGRVSPGDAYKAFKAQPPSWLRKAWTLRARDLLERPRTVGCCSGGHQPE